MSHFDFSYEAYVDLAEETALSDGMPITAGLSDGVATASVSLR